MFLSIFNALKYLKKIMDSQLEIYSIIKQSFSCVEHNRCLRFTAECISQYGFHCNSILQHTTTHHYYNSCKSKFYVCTFFSFCFMSSFFFSWVFLTRTVQLHTMLDTVCRITNKVPATIVSPIGGERGVVSIGSYTSATFNITEGDVCTVQFPATASFNENSG